MIGSENLSRVRVRARGTAISMEQGPDKRARGTAISMEQGPDKSGSGLGVGVQPYLWNRGQTRVGMLRANRVGQILVAHVLNWGVGRRGRGRSTKTVEVE